VARLPGLQQGIDVFFFFAVTAKHLWHFCAFPHFKIFQVVSKCPQICDRDCSVLLGTLLKFGLPQLALDKIPGQTHNGQGESKTADQTAD